MANIPVAHVSESKSHVIMTSPSTSAVVLRSANIVFHDTVQRARRTSKHVCLVAGGTICAGLMIPGTSASKDSYIDSYGLVDSPANATPSTLANIKEEAQHYHAWFEVPQWEARGAAIRSGANVQQCLGNLSYALLNLSPLYQAEYNGSSSALGLLPTAGALVSAPTREMWILFKLVPVSGILSMCLSLGATITPSNAADYDPNRPFSYGGIIAAARPYAEQPVTSQPTTKNGDSLPDPLTGPQKFAHRVRARANQPPSPTPTRAIYTGTIIQLFLIAAMLTAMRYAQRGGIIPWWCVAWGWMWFWYVLVIITTIFDSIVSAPFTRNWVLRVSKAPAGLRGLEGFEKLDLRKGESVLEQVQRAERPRTRLSMASGRSGMGTTNTAPAPAAFCVIISLDGHVTRTQALLRILAKGCTAAVFAFGTTLFASASLMSVNIVLMVLAVLLTCGVLGRITALWMTAEMTKEVERSPVLHAVARSMEEVGEYFRVLCAEGGLMVEMDGCVIVEGRVVHRRREWLMLERYVGVLARPFDIRKVARKRVEDEP